MFSPFNIVPIAQAQAYTCIIYWSDISSCLDRQRHRPATQQGNSSMHMFWEVQLRQRSGLTSVLYKRYVINLYPFTLLESLNNVCLNLSLSTTSKSSLIVRIAVFVKMNVSLKIQLHQWFPQNFLPTRTSNYVDYQSPLQSFEFNAYHQITISDLIIVNQYMQLFVSLRQQDTVRSFVSHNGHGEFFKYARFCTIKLIFR